MIMKSEMGLNNDDCPCYSWSRFRSPLAVLLRIFYLLILHTILSFAASIIPVSNALAADQPAVVLEYKYAPGDVLEYALDSTIEVEQLSEMQKKFRNFDPSAPERSDANYTMHYEFNTVEEFHKNDENKGLSVDLQFTRYLLDRDENSKSITQEFMKKGKKWIRKDALHTQSSAILDKCYPKILCDEQQGIKNRTFTYCVEPQGALSDSEDLSAASLVLMRLKNLNEKYQSICETNRDVREVCHFCFDQNNWDPLYIQDMERLLKLLRPVFPQSPLRPGDKWTQSIPVVSLFAYFDDYKGLEAEFTFRKLLIEDDSRYAIIEAKFMDNEDFPVHLDNWDISDVSFHVDMEYVFDIDAGVMEKVTFNTSHALYGELEFDCSGALWFYKELDVTVDFNGSYNLVY